MKREQRKVKKEKRTKKKSCFDCLYCKVSAASTEKCRFCFCSKAKKKIMHKANYWLSKKLCKKFDDMSA